MKNAFISCNDLAQKVAGFAKAKAGMRRKTHAFRERSETELRLHEVQDYRSCNDLAQRIFGFERNPNTVSFGYGNEVIT